MERFIEKLEELREVKEAFTILLDDPTGNSFMQNPYPLSQSRGGGGMGGNSIV